MYNNKTLQTYYTNQQFCQSLPLYNVTSKCYDGVICKRKTQLH